MIVQYQHNDDIHTVSLERHADGTYTVVIGEDSHTVEAQMLRDGVWLLSVDGVRTRATVAAQGKARFVHLAGQHIALTVPDVRSRRRAQSGGSGDLTAQMPGQVLAVAVAVGDTVERGQTLMILEAMKMEIRVSAPMDGVVKNIFVAVGDTVERGQTLLVITPD
ncbi:MAG: biotin/lipoyl-binding protein [Chloroflexi bacterium]|nr:MAG: biotin/lipoyl-binding protein [Chloroflexota bacterium]